MTDFSEDAVTRAIEEKMAVTEFLRCVNVEEKHEKYMLNEHNRKLAIAALDWLIENDPKWAKIIIVNAQEKLSDGH